MFKIFIPVRSLKTLNPAVFSRSFCIYAAYLNPEKHIYMTHNPSNVYEDILQIGDYVLPNRPMVREVSRVHVPKILSLLTSELKKTYPNAKLDPKDYENFKLNSWKKQGVTDIDSVKNAILEVLSKEIFVKESKFRFTIEQRNRLTSSIEIFNQVALNDRMIEFFVEAYNYLIRLEVDRSNLWRDPKIKGESSFIEKSVLEAQKPVTGIEDLERDIPENKSWINRLMAKLHSA